MPESHDYDFVISRMPIFSINGNAGSSTGSSEIGSGTGTGVGGGNVGAGVGPGANVSGGNGTAGGGNNKPVQEPPKPEVVETPEQAAAREAVRQTQSNLEAAQRAVVEARNQSAALQKEAERLAGIARRAAEAAAAQETAMRQAAEAATAASQQKFIPQTIDQSDTQRILGNVLINGSSLLGRNLTPEIIKNNKLEPKYKVVIGGVTIYLSAAYDKDGIRTRLRMMLIRVLKMITDIKLF